MKKGLFLLLMSLFFSMSTANASVISYSDRNVFTSQGITDYNYGFEDIIAKPTYFPGKNWTTNGVTYHPYNNLILGPSPAFPIFSSTHSPLSNILANNNAEPIVASIFPSYNMFAFDMGRVACCSGYIHLNVSTNWGTYMYNNLSTPSLPIPYVNIGMKFYGFISEPGEYFTGFTLIGSEAPGIDNVTLGHITPPPAPPSAPVPEPSTIFLLGSGLVGLAVMRQKLR